VTADPRAAASALGGELAGRDSILCPGPGHRSHDRSLSVRLDPRAPDGFVTNSFAGDDWRQCRNHVRRALGIERRREHAPQGASRNRARADELQAQVYLGSSRALVFWGAAVDPRGTLVERYLRSRQLEIGSDIAGPVLRFHPGIKAMVALFRNIETDEPQAISRTFLDPAGRKLDRKFLGPVRGAAIKLDPDENVLAGLHVAEGVETALAARQLGLSPVWALGSAGAIAAFPILPGVEAQTILAENDEASARAVSVCADRWHKADREVFINRSTIGKDLNDAIRGSR